MPVTYPRPALPGDVVAVPAPSAGVPEPLVGRLEHAVEVVRARGFDVRLGESLVGGGVVSAPAAARAAELTAMLTDPAVRAVVPPWGGDLATDLLGSLDWEALAADPTWFVGYSDCSTVMLPLTLRTGVATLHGNNLMDTPYTAPDGVATWLDVVGLEPGAELVQRSPRRYRSSGWDDWEADPRASEWTLDTPGAWVRLDGAGPEEPVDVSGRLVGGCLETVAFLAGTRFGDVPAFAAEHAPEGLVVYVDVAGWGADDVARGLWGLRHAGWFDAANAVLVSRWHGSDTAALTRHDAVRHALGDLGVPVLAEVECGHVPPHLVLVNGALARVQHGPDVSVVTQRLV